MTKRFMETLFSEQESLWPYIVVVIGQQYSAVQVVGGCSLHKKTKRCMEGIALFLGLFEKSEKGYPLFVHES